jgi:hypothetical protein
MDDDRDDPVAEDGCRRVGLAGNDTRAPGGNSASDQLEVESRNVHQHVRIPELAGDPAPALEVQLDLPDALADWHVELFERRLRHDAVDRKPMGGLETTDRPREG